jgi:PAS domain S-box-containing protein
MESMSKLPIDLHSLSAQMILSYVALALVTAALAGLPALWLIGLQLDQQAWAQVQQGAVASQALYEAQESELIGLARLTAQRPTLRELLRAQDWEPLGRYLWTLQEGAAVDALLLCDVQGEVVAQAGEAARPGLCTLPITKGPQMLTDGEGLMAWFLASQPLAGEPLAEADSVVLGRVLDDTFAAEMRAQTGLEHTLLADGQVVAASWSERRQPSTAERRPLSRGERDARRAVLQANGDTYYASYVALDGSGLLAEVALNVNQIMSAKRRLVWTLVISIVAVGGLASVVAGLLARRIGRPLASLAASAGAMSLEDLETPLAVEPGVREVALVAQALESARSDLKQALAELLAEKAWTDQLLEAIVEGIVTLNRKGQITYFSRGAERITGWARGEVLGQSCDLVFGTQEPGIPFSQQLPPPGQRRKVAVELRHGRHAVLALTGARLAPPEGGSARVALVFRDVSEEEAMHQLLAHFLANVAHEFRTPLSALAASVELLLDQAPDLSPAELAELLASLHLGVLGLQTLIDNLLEGASIEAGHFRVHPRPWNLGEIIADAVKTMQPLLDRREQRLVVELPAAIPVVQADPRRTVQVLVNLLSNASKYGPDRAEIEISATMHGDGVRVAVADTGPGIPAQQRQDLFRRFRYPASQDQGVQVGVGLGLSVVRAIVEAHGGQVGVEDREGGGSAFWFTLPGAGQASGGEG